MSLTSFVSVPEIRARLRAEFPIQVSFQRGEILATPKTRNYTIVGTAFDYLLRFLIERLNPNSHKKRWVAELAVEQLPGLTDGSEVVQRAQTALSKAREAYETYRTIGSVSNDLIGNAIVLAQLDFVFRGHKPYPGLGNVEEDDVADLRKLIEIVPTEAFVAKRVCVLNPTFGEASSIVGGADADLFIDNNLIDVKTTQKMSLDRGHIDQLIGYYLLSRIGRTIGDVADARISELSIYFSRHAQFASLSTTLVEQNPKLDQITKWFAEEARRIFTSA